MELKLIREIPASLNKGAFDRAIAKFVVESKDPNVPLDDLGYYKSLVETIGANLILKTTQDDCFIWLAEGKDHEVLSFGITYLTKAVDSQPTYLMKTAWVDKSVRRKPIVKKWFNTMCQHGEMLGTKHLLVYSSRGIDSYLRWLGKDWHYYTAILKKDVN